MSVEQRKGIAKKLSVLQASQRATAKALGVGEQTVARDLGKNRGAPHGASVDAQAARDAGLDRERAPHGAPVAITASGSAAAKAADREAAS